ncbi:MAG: hypothetical protein JWR09_3372 [Mucilaginibacter sp.]|nr:hypothetical protein [Mucilaginibacter sp.]
MIAEEPIYNSAPSLSISAGKTIEYLVGMIAATITPFKTAIRQSNLIKPLNENKLTQIFLEQLEVKIKPNPFIGVKNQYSDIFLGTKGIPDFYFHVVEENVVHTPLFIVESKRLPSPSYEKEYVIGENKNGGIERFKLEKHGKGLVQCGMLGFIEKEEISFWLKAINNFIEDLSESDAFWNKDEILSIDVNNDLHYAYLKSIAHTLKAGDKLLHHFWVKQ